jgi:hypothetical protein
MSRRGLIILHLIIFPFIFSCGEEEFKPVSESIYEELGIEPLDYSNPENWGCLGHIKGDVCDEDFSLSRIDPDGTVKLEKYNPDPNPAVDCFYIYPTVDYSLKPGNHDDLKDVAMPLEVIKSQAGRFSEVCRVFAPFYRQVTIGTYLYPSDEEMRYMKKAFADVLRAFEYYLENWNEGRPAIIMGHSQGAFMATLLLYLYFDREGIKVSKKNGGINSDGLRKKLVVALPIGHNVYVKKGDVKGGTFKNIPICTRVEETGCVIHYRSYPEGFEFKRDLTYSSSRFDKAFAKEGFLYTPFDSEKMVMSCVNPSTKPLPEGHRAVDSNGNDVGEGDVRVLEGTYLIGLFALFSDFQTDPIYQHIPERYTATCRQGKIGNYLAIGFHINPFQEDVRSDPAGVGKTTSNSPLGLHLYDFNLSMGDLISQIKIKIDAYLKGYH